MINRVLNDRSYRVWLLLPFFAVGVGCTKDDGVNYCKNHYTFHDQHRDSVASMNIKYSEAGELTGEVFVPLVTFGDAAGEAIDEMLSQSGNVLMLQTASPCAVTVAEVLSTDAGYTAKFSASCGADNKLAQIDVPLFDNVDKLDEVVVVVETSATSKRFGISRQCDAPIFRLDSQ